MAKFIVMAVGKEVRVDSWADRQTGVVQEHKMLDVYLGEISDKYDGIMPMKYHQVTTKNGNTFDAYNGRVTLMDRQLEGRKPVPLDIVECEFTQDGRLQFRGFVG